MLNYRHLEHTELDMYANLELYGLLHKYYSCSLDTFCWNLPKSQSRKNFEKS